MAFENMVGDGNQLFSFAQCFNHFQIKFHFSVTFILFSINAFNLDWSKILFNLLPDGKVSAFTKLKAFTEDKFNVA